MASLEDYDEFGNYIGADLESDEEEEVQQHEFTRPAASQQPLEGYEEDDAAAPNEDALMEIDGSLPLSC
jgi:116 kDa U5 small nuclear ribonucleoprotein component